MITHRLTRQEVILKQSVLKKKVERNEVNIDVSKYYHTNMATTF